MLAEFIVEYWYLFATLALIVLMLSFDLSNKVTGGTPTITPTQLPALQSKKKAVIFDLEEADVFSKGHISRAINVPFSTLENPKNKLKKYKDKTVILTCKNGMRSKKAAITLKKQAFSDVYILTGGIDAWKKDNLPLEKQPQNTAKQSHAQRQK